MIQTELNNLGLRAYFSHVTIDQARDTGMAMVLICLLLAYWGHQPKCLPLAIALLLLSMAWPKIFRPPAVLWFGLSHLMGTMVSKVFLIVLFFGLITPIGLIRRMIRHDSLKLRQWKKDSSSVLVSREGWFWPEDLVNPY